MEVSLEVNYRVVNVYTLSRLHHSIISLYTYYMLYIQVTDLRYLIQQYEHWANSLYPKLTFKDVTDRIEKLATKKEFKVSINSCILYMYHRKLLMYMYMYYYVQCVSLVC